MIQAFSYLWPDNTATRNYIKLINDAQCGKFETKDVYCERHHIIPRSLGGGDSQCNLVTLPACYHYYAHYWLMKMFPEDTKQGRSMTHAFRKMNQGRDYQDRPANAVLFAEARDRAARAGSGRKMSETNKQKLREAHLGKPRTDETKAKISASHKGKKLTEEHKKKIAPWGRVNSPETIEKRRLHYVGAKRSEQAKLNMREGRRRAKEARLLLEHSTFPHVRMLADKTQLL